MHLTGALPDPAAQLAATVRQLVADELARISAATPKPPAPPRSPFRRGERLTYQLQLRMTDPERELVERACGRLDVWDSATPLPRHETIRRLMWEGARVLGLLEAAPVSAPAASAAA